MRQRSSVTRVLVVDDESLLARSLADALRAFGFETQQSTSGLEALRILEKQPLDFQVLIVDRRMPEIDGMEVIMRAKLVAPSIRAVLYSGSPTTAAEAAVDAVLTKPCDIREITAVIERLVGRNFRSGSSTIDTTV